MTASFTTLLRQGAGPDLPSAIASDEAGLAFPLSCPRGQLSRPPHVARERALPLYPCHLTADGWGQALPGSHSQRWPLCNPLSTIVLPRSGAGPTLSTPVASEGQGQHYPHTPTTLL